jgi:precorrin-6B methylase 1
MVEQSAAQSIRLIPALSASKLTLDVLNAKLDLRSISMLSTHKRTIHTITRIAKNCVATLLPVSARERFKPDTAEVNGEYIHLPLREPCICEPSER